MEYRYVLYNGTLYHYGIPGMKWGVKRATYKMKNNEKLSKKALDYDRQAAKLTKKSEKAHSKFDLEEANNKARKAASYDARAASVAKRAAKQTNDMKSLMLTRKSENLKYKAAKTRVKADRMSKSKGYGVKAMKYSIKSDKAAARAALARKKMANNNYYIGMMKRKASSLSPEEIKGGYSFVNELLAS